MSKKEIIEQYSLDEIAGSAILTQRLGPKQKKEAGLQLKAARKKLQLEISEKDRLVLKLMQFKFKIDDYLDSRAYDPKLTFSHFLKEYVNLLEKKRRHFAAEIDINETELSQLINNHRFPGDNIMVRLEIHSNNTIPAVTWFKIVEKEKEYALQTNRAIRQQEKKYVKNKLVVQIG